MMHHILIAIKEIIDSNLKLYLPHVASDHLENNGAVYYMNGKDGTEFDWYINEKFPPFMVFYNDKANLGAVKLLLYKDGGIVIYLFDDCGKKLVKEVHTELKATKTELFTLVVLLKDQADDKKLWNADITNINTDIQLHNDTCNQFRRNQKNYGRRKSSYGGFERNFSGYKSIKDDKNPDFVHGTRAGFFAGYFTAIASISQRTPFGSSFTATQLRAGLEVK